MINRWGWQGLFTCGLALVTCGWGCDAESGDGAAATGASSGMPAGGATGGSAEPASGGGGGQEPACECDSFVCGATIDAPRVHMPPECGSIGVTVRWLAGEDCELVAFERDAADCTFVAYYSRQDGGLSGTHSHCVGGPACVTYDAVPPRCPGTECVLCDPSDWSNLPPCEPL